MIMFLAGFAAGALAALGFRGLLRRRPKGIEWRKEWDGRTG
jgi:hypothetical protein